MNIKEAIKLYTLNIIPKGYEKDDINMYGIALRLILSELSNKDKQIAKLAKENNECEGRLFVSRTQIEVIQENLNNKDKVIEELKQENGRFYTRDINWSNRYRNTIKKKDKQITVLKFKNHCLENKPNEILYCTSCMKLEKQIELMAEHIRNTEMLSPDICTKKNRILKICCQIECTKCVIQYFENKVKEN